MPTKSILLSKTFWVQMVAVLTIVAAQFSPSIATFLTENFSAVGGGWAFINVVLRLVSKDKIELL